MDVTWIIGVVYAIFAVITMIVYDVHNYKKNKKGNAKTTYWDSVLDSGSVNVGIVWPITLPFLLKEIASDSCDAYAFSRRMPAPEHTKGRDN